MKKINFVVILLIVIIIITFLLGFSVAKSNSDTNQNINNINTNTKDKTKVDINKADKFELMSIRGVGDKKAELIINNRPYNSIWDLSKIDGISEDFITNIREEVCVNAKS